MVRNTRKIVSGRMVTMVMLTFKKKKNLILTSVATVISIVTLTNAVTVASVVTLTTVVIRWPKGIMSAILTSVR